LQHLNYTTVVTFFQLSYRIYQTSTKLYLETNWPFFVNQELRAITFTLLQQMFQPAVGRTSDFAFLINILNWLRCPICHKLMQNLPTRMP